MSDVFTETPVQFYKHSISV